MREIDVRTTRYAPYVPGKKYEYWPDCHDFETDIHTTCEEMGREHCPYDTGYKHASVLCEWKAKGATNWMMEAEFASLSGKGVPGDHLRSAFHESGQFFLDGKHGSGDDGMRSSSTRI